MSVPTKNTCQCGASLCWERRSTRGGDRWLALCSNPDCGAITLLAGADYNLLGFLLGPTPPVRFSTARSPFRIRQTGGGLIWLAPGDQAAGGYLWDFGG